MKPGEVEALFRVFEKANPKPKTELRFRNDFELLVAVMLSAQATDVSVNKVTPALFEKAPTPEAMAKLGQEGVTPFIKSIGLFNSKAANVAKTCQILVEEHGGKIPNTREALTKLPGVGDKTAGVVMNVAHGASTIPVDTHVFRVSNRTGLTRTKTPKATEKRLLEVLPRWAVPNAHHWLILHGRYVCKARKPDCAGCAAAAFCEYDHKTDQPKE